MDKIRVAIVGIGNCASALVQGISYYGNDPSRAPIGLMHQVIGGYRPEDIEVVIGFDIDRRKVGKDISRAVFSPPNCTKIFCNDVRPTGATVHMGPIMDGLSEHMLDHEPARTFVPSSAPQPDKATIVRLLRQSKAEIMLNYLPVGSEKATRFYAKCALEAGLAFINNIPVFVASDSDWADRFKERGLPIIGDDIKSQLGATITHRILADLFRKRGVKLERTYQLNTGGNTDFLNMLNRHRLASKKLSKTEAVQAVCATRMNSDDIHIGPSDYVAWQKDNKVCFIRMEGRLFGDVPMELELRLSVEDSPNSAAVAIDAIRCAKLALDRGLAGALEGPSAYFCKHPPRQFSDQRAWRLTEEFINQDS